MRNGFAGPAGAGTVDAGERTNAQGDYEATGSPYISLRIQELYDVTQTPKIALGRVPVLVHILTPGMKPIQITQDLASFWREHYPRIKSELQRKYPKHLWR